MAKHDLGIAGQFSEIVRQIQCDRLNPHWVQSMMQYIIEDNHSGDREFCKTFLKLERPTLRQVADLLEVEQTAYNRPFDKGLRERVERIALSDGPNEVEVVKVTEKTLFERTLCNLSERQVRAKAFELLELVPCPTWTVPALAIASLKVSDKEKTGHDQLMVCLAEAEQAKYGGFNVIYGNNWWVHGRSSSLETTWNPVTWLMAKPFRGWAH